jgi:hypothetical protein
MLVPKLDERVDVKGIDIVLRQRMLRSVKPDAERAAYRFRRFGDALYDLLPTRGFDAGVVDCRDKIGLARHGDGPPPGERPRKHTFS